MHPHLAQHFLLQCWKLATDTANLYRQRSHVSHEENTFPNSTPSTTGTFHFLPSEAATVRTKYLDDIAFLFS